MDEPRRSSGAQERWRKLSELFDRALEVARDRQARWVDECCGEDRAMADELKKMLEAFHTSGVLDAPPPTLPHADAPVAERLAAALHGRYVLDEEIGRGGMGTIFRAHELKHQRGVILKVLRPEIGYSVGRQRFEAEVQIAAKLAHPHIVPLLDSGDAGGLLYFVMPHLPGETLRARLDRLGTFAVADAVKLLRDIADALHYAHEAGVVHRDLKPENVLCSGDHAFLLDFGIAQYVRDTPGDDRITREGHAVGTPRYMAPEQAAGRAVDHRADIYAWGLVANEMLHGSRQSVLDHAVGRSDLPEALNALILKCLAPDPAHRPRSAGTLVAALDAMTSVGVEHPVNPSPPGRASLTGAGAHPGPVTRRWRFATFIAVGAALVAWLAWSVDRVPGTVRPGDVVMPIAVAPFRDDGVSGDLAVRGRLAAAWITQGLHEAGLFQVIPWSDVLQAVEGEADPTVAARSRLRAGTLVTGVFYDTPEALTLHVEVRETRRGALVVSLPPVSVPRDSTTLAIRTARDRVLGALAARRDPRFASVAPGLERPPTFDAYRAFDRALAQFNAQQYRQALDGFRAAYALDSSFIAPLVYAGQAAWNVGQTALLDSILDRLDARCGELTDYHEHLRAYLRAQLDGDGAAAYAAASAAAALAPDSRAAYDAALTALRLGRASEARARLEALSPDRGAMLGWPSYWTNLAHARHLVGDFDGDLQAARQMRRRHPELRVAWVLEARAHAARRDTVRLDSLLAAARDLPAETYWSQAGMLVVAGEELAAHGDSASGMRYLARALTWTGGRLALHRDYGDHLFWQGSALHSLGRFTDARDALARYERTTDRRVAAREQLALAEERAGVVGALARVPPPEPFEAASRRVAEARMAAARGDAALARARMEEALRQGYRSWPWLHSAGWRDFLPLRGDATLMRLVGQ